MHNEGIDLTRAASQLDMERSLAARSLGLGCQRCTAKPQATLAVIHQMESSLDLRTQHVPHLCLQLRSDRLDPIVILCKLCTHRANPSSFLSRCPFRGPLQLLELQDAYVGTKLACKWGGCHMIPRE